MTGAQERGQLLHEAIGAAAKRVAAEHAAEVERRILDGEDDFTVLVGPPAHRVAHRYQVPSPWRHPIRRGRIALARRRHRRTARPAEQVSGGQAVEVVVDFLVAWRYCPVARSENASRGDLEDAAKQLLDALADAGRVPGEQVEDGGMPPANAVPGDRHVRTALALLQQAAPAIEKERSTRLDGPLMSVLDARDELEKVDMGDTGRLDRLYRRQLLLRRFQLFPVEWAKLPAIQAWLGVTEHEAEEALAELRDDGLIHVDALGRWALNSAPRREAIEHPILDLPVDAVEERRRRAELERRTLPLDTLALQVGEAQIIQEFLGERRAAANPEERELLKRLRVFAEGPA